jgi:predicted Na+-dependent transporter
MTADWRGVAGNGLLFLLVMGMSATVDVGCMATQLRNGRAIAAGALAQFVILPLLGFGVVRMFQLPPALGIPLLVVTSSPGGSYSNW